MNMTTCTGNESMNLSSQRLQELIAEIMSGEHEKDILVNASYDFAKEFQAAYFSNTRKNLQSDVAHRVMAVNQDLDGINILKGIKKNGRS